MSQAPWEAPRGPVGRYRTPGGHGVVVARTCAWGCAVLLALIPLAGVAAGVAGVATGDAATNAMSTIFFCLWMWLVVVVVAWLLGWPVGLLVERQLAVRGVSDRVRAVVLGGVGAGLALAVGSLLGLWAAPDLLAILCACGAVGAGGGRAIVAARDRRSDVRS